jgi:hypothetical protein
MVRSQSFRNGAICAAFWLFLSACAGSSSGGAAPPIAVNQAGVGERLTFGQMSQSEQAPERPDSNKPDAEQAGERMKGD